MKIKNSNDFFIYFKSLVRFAPKRFVLGCALTILNTLFAGIGLLMLIPLLHYAGWLSGIDHTDGGLNKIIAYLPSVSGKLPLVITLGLYVGVISFIAGLDYMARKVLFDLQQDYLYDLQKKLNTAIAHAQWHYLLQQKLKHVENMLFSGLSQISALTHHCLQMVSGIIVIGLYLAFSFVISPALTAVTLFACLILFLFSYKHKALRNGQENFLLQRKLNEEIGNFLSGVKLAKSYNTVQNYINYFDTLNYQRIQNQSFFLKEQRIVACCFKIASAAVFSVVFYIAFQFFTVSFVTLFALLAVFSRLLPRISTLQQNYLQVLNISPVYVNAEKMLSAFNAVQEDNTIVDQLAIKNKIQLINISYRYTDSWVLKNIACTFYANTITAIVGHSGAGKSTLSDLLLGLLIPLKGVIKVDEVTLTQSNLFSWRNLISYVPQEAYFFNDTLRANLLWAFPTATDDAIWVALKRAAADEFVARLPDKLDTLIGDRGMHFSGGERQRLALTRALLRNPKVLLLDEATNALDAKNEEIIYQTLKNLKASMTIILIAHHLTTIRLADRVLVMHQGEIVEQGDFERLRADNQSYFSQIF